MTNYRNIKIKQEGAVFSLWLNRPEKHNALNPDLMREVIHLFQWLENIDEVRIVILRGEGKSFCAGADLNWMKESAKLNREENLQESQLLSDFFSTIYHSRLITIAIAHGNIFGGGNGLVAACDIAYGLSNSKFSLSETRLGLIAASITSYMLKRLNTAVYKELIFTARPFSGIEAKEYGLLNNNFETFEELEVHLQNVLMNIKMAGPNSLKGSKRLINDLTDTSKTPEILKQIPKILAEVRITDEAKEGFAAFLEKRSPNWM